MEAQEVNLTAKVSNTSISSEINKLEINSENVQELSNLEQPISEIQEIPKSDNESASFQIDNEKIDQKNEIDQTMKVEKEEISHKNELLINNDQSASSSSKSSSQSSSSSFSECQQPQKRKRKRKRKRKVKAIAAYIPDEPFTKRYKKTILDISMKPKLHVKFDESGNIVSYQNNYKPRIVRALPENLSITDGIKGNKLENFEDKIQIEKVDESLKKPIVSLKPRIIKAIGT